MPLGSRRSLALAGLASLAAALPSVVDAQPLTFAGHGVRGGSSNARFQGGDVRGVIDVRYVRGLVNALPTDVLDARHVSWVVTAGIELR